jgi:hypothetical protein
VGANSSATQAPEAGRQYAVLSERAKIKRLTMQQRRKDYLAEQAA